MGVYPRIHIGSAKYGSRDTASWSCEEAHLVKLLAVSKSDGLLLILGAHVVERENGF